MTVPALEVRGLGKTFGSSVVLSSLDLRVERGQVHALLGENGSGKSTFIKILSGYHSPDPGATIEINGRPLPHENPAASHELGLRFVHQTLGLVGSLSVADNLLIGSGFPTRLGTVSRRRANQMTRNALARVGLDIDPAQTVARLSQAERTGVAIARALFDTTSDAERGIALLVLDEPTATLPAVEVERLLHVVRTAATNGTGVIYVTHRLDEVFSVADSATVLRDGRRVTNTPVAGLTRDRLLHYLVGGEFDEVRRDRLKQAAAPNGSPRLRVLDLHGARVSGVSFEAHPHEIVGIAGIVGSGREELGALLFGAIERHEGRVEVDGVPVAPSRPRSSIAAGVAYVPSDRSRFGIFPTLSARDNLTITNLRPAWRWPRLSRRIEQAECQTWFDDLEVRPRDGQAVQIRLFSGGNQQKVVFAKWLRRRPRVFLLDEPTQGVDVKTKAVLHYRLIGIAAEGAALVLSSSDVDELVAVCQRVLVMRGGRIVADLRGDEVTAARITRESLGSGKAVAQ